jgi:acyl-coenzyme A synthetase/AMP-(fatty) acid ligase
VTLAEDAIPSPDLARDVRAHLPEILGGLARPQTIAFIDEFPADLGPDERRSALSALCATAVEDSVHLSAKQLRVSAAAQARK